MTTKVADIQEGDRARKEYKSIESLAESIKEKGLVQPIVLTKDLQLIAGGRRLRAIKELGWEEIPDEYVLMKGDLSSVELRELELLENLERQDLTWKEEIDAKAEIDRLKKELYGDSEKDRSRSSWSTRKSAELVGESPSNFADDVSLSKAIKSVPELANCETKTEARRTLNRMYSRHERDIKLRQYEERDNFDDVQKYAKDHFRIGDTLEGLKGIQSTYSYFAEVDPPYAIALDEITKNKPSRSKADQHVRYTEIPPEEYPQFCEEVARELYRVLGDDAWVVWWFGWGWYSTIYDTLIKVGFKVDKVPLIWYKEHSQWANPNPKYLLSRDHEQAFLCRKGNVWVEKSKGCTFIHQGVASINRTCSAEKPVELYEEIIDTLLPRGVRCIGIIPFLGSGNCLRALYNKGHTGFGWDLDEENKKYFLSKVFNSNIEEE